MFSISEFKNNIKIVRPNLFYAEIATLPKFVSGSSTIRNVLDTFKFRCETTELPGKTIATADEQAYGPTKKFAYDVTYNDLNLQIIASQDMNERKFFEDWMDNIITSTDMNFANFKGGMSKYYDDYASCIIKIHQLNENGKKICTYTLYNAYPIQLSPMNLSWEETNTYQRFTATITYRHHIVEFLNSPFVSGSTVMPPAPPPTVATFAPATPPAAPPSSSRRRKIICTKLYELGYLDHTIYDLDQKFGDLLVKNNPDVYNGYISWAQTVVDWMEGNGPQFMFWIKDKSDRQQAIMNLTTKWAVEIATPWAKHMAHVMEKEHAKNTTGKFLMFVGKPVCKMIGLWQRKFGKSNKPAGLLKGFTLLGIFAILKLIVWIAREPNKMKVDALKTY